MPSKRRKMASSVVAVEDARSREEERVKKLKSGGGGGGGEVGVDGAAEEVQGSVSVALKSGEVGRRGGARNGGVETPEGLKIGEKGVGSVGEQDKVADVEEDDDDDVDDEDEEEEEDEDEVGSDEEDEDSEEEEELWDEGLEDDDEDEDEEEEDDVVEDQKDGVMGRILLSPSGRLVLTNDGALDLGPHSGDESVEGSRSRSEEDLGAIGGATRIEDTGASPWKEVDLIDWDAPAAESSQEKAVGPEIEGVKSATENEAAAAGAESKDVGNKLQELDLMNADMVSADSAGGDSKSEEATSVSMSEEGGTGSDGGSAGKEGKDSAKSSAYSRAFSKIFKSKAAAESDVGPVLSARQALIAKKLEEEAGESKEKKDSRKEKKELREKAHLYPQSFTDTKEKDLIKLATRGVVKLFNAVSKAQKVQAGADSRDPKVVAKRSKSAFLSEMRGTRLSSTSVAANGWSGRGQQSPSTPTLQFGTVESRDEPASRWSVVQDSFMVGKQKLKDWDKEEEMGGIEGSHMIGNQIVDGPFSEDDDSDDD